MKLILRTLFFIFILSLFSISIISIREAIITDTYTVVEDSIVVSQDVSAKVFRTEKELNSKVKGDVSYNVQNLQKVHKGQKIANVYHASLLPETRERIAYLNNRIALLEEQISTTASYEHNGEGLTLASRAFQKQVIEQASKNDYQKIANAKNSFLSFLGNADAKKEVKNLQKERKNLENKQKGQYATIIAPISGVFIQSEPIGKIVDNYEMNMTTTVPNTLLENTYVGNSYSINFLDFDIKTTGEITGIQKLDVKNSVVSFVVRNYTYKFYDIDEINAGITFSSNYGLKLPKEAIVTRDDISGVYIKYDKLKEFRPVEIVARNEEFVIIKSNEKIKQYDEVVIKH